jgi:hypothetical protein
MTELQGMGVINGRTVNPNRKPRVSAKELKYDCISYFKSDRSDAVIFGNRRTRKPHRRKESTLIINRDIALMERMGTVHNEATA